MTNALKYHIVDNNNQVFQHIVDYLGAVTLQQLIDDQKAKQNGVVQVQDMRATLAKREPMTLNV